MRYNRKLTEFLVRRSKVRNYLVGSLGLGRLTIEWKKNIAEGCLR